MRRRLPLILLVVWTLLVWSSRIRNVLQDDDLSGFGTAWRLGAAALFLVLAVAAAVRTRPWLAVLVAWTVGWWLVRGIGILVDDHDVGFKVVHTVLMVVSIGLAMWAWQRRDG